MIRRNSDPVDQLGLLVDSLIEMPEPGEEVYTDASQWPAWCDDSIAQIGAALSREEFFGDTEEPVCDEPYEPSDLDLLDFELWLERLETERAFGINARFVP